MSSQRYERVSNNDEIETPTSAIPVSPPPSFRSRASSPSSRRLLQDSDSLVDQNLADAFDADGSDDEDNSGDERQRFMRGSPPSASIENFAATATTPDVNTPTPPRIERRPTYLPAFVPTGRIYGGGSGSDGVFANLSAKPEAGEKIEEHPPTYEQAAADAAPPYWETTILAPGLGGPDEVYIEGLPVGSVFSFIWNGMISMSFQLVGFLLTYLLHTTHAAKNGSRAGLGITLIQYGFYMKGGSNDAAPPGSDPSPTNPSDPDAHDFDPNAVASTDTTSGSSWSDVASSDWIAYLLMIVGWFILIRAVSNFLKARRHEQLVLQSPERGLNVPIIATGEQSETVV